jgi:uncharacterized protein YjbI with pentapeptide repeats
MCVSFSMYGLIYSWLVYLALGCVVTNVEPTVHESLASVDLKNLYLSSMDLSNADLKGANLEVVV